MHRISPQGRDASPSGSTAGQTPLDMAAHRGRLGCVRTLLSLGANPRGAAAAAAAAGASAAALTQPRASVGSITAAASSASAAAASASTATTGFHRACAAHGAAEVALELLWSGGAEMRDVPTGVTPSGGGDSPLAIAVASAALRPWSESAEAPIWALLEHGADPNELSQQPRWLPAGAEDDAGDAVVGGAAGGAISGGGWFYSAAQRCSLVQGALLWYRRRGWRPGPGEQQQGRVIAAALLLAYGASLLSRFHAPAPSQSVCFFLFRCARCGSC